MTTDLKDLFPEVKDLDEKSVYALLNSIKKNFDSSSFDYLKFKQSVKALLKMNMDAETSYKSAFTTATTMGLTKEKLLNSANRYIYALEQERESFAKALINQKKIKVEGRKSEVVDLQQKIENHKLKIKELEREIDIFQSRIDSVDHDVEIANNKIEGTKKKFLDVYTILEKAIKEDIVSINQIL